MKTHFYFWLLLLFSTTNQAQDYTPFYLDNARWIIHETIPGMGASGGELYWEFYTKTDTIINGQTYRQLATKNLCKIHSNIYGSYTDTTVVTNQEAIIGGLREANKQVYFLRFAEALPFRSLQHAINFFSPNEEHLLYEFAPAIGDTTFYDTITFFDYNTNESYERKFYVTTIAELEPRMGHRTWEIQPNTRFIRPETGYQHEGIGSSYGLFGHYGSSLKNLTHFSVNGEAILYNGNTDPCARLVNNITEQQSPTLEIFPNPATDQLFFKYPISLSVKQIRIIDVNGHLLYHKSNPNSVDSVTIDQLSAGLYFLQLELIDGRIITKKFSKTLAK